MCAELGVRIPPLLSSSVSVQCQGPDIHAPCFSSFFVVKTQVEGSFPHRVFLMVLYFFFVECLDSCFCIWLLLCLFLCAMFFPSYVLTPPPLLLNWWLPLVTFLICFPIYSPCVLCFCLASHYTVLPDMFSPTE